MTGVDHGLAGESQNLFADPGQKLIAVAAGEIPTAHAIGKKNVPSEELTGFRKIKTETARTVSRNQQQLGAGPRRRNGARLFQEPGGANGAEALRQTEGEHGIGFETEKRGVGVIVDGATGPIGKVGGIPDMVPMAVGEEKRVGLELFLLEELKETFRCIDRDAMPSQIDQVGVGGGKTAAEAQRFGHEVGVISVRLGLGLG